MRSPLPPMRSGEPRDFGALHRAAVDYYLSLFDPSTGGFRFSSGCPATLTATGYCVLGLEFSNGLDDLSEDRRRAIVSFLSTGARPDGSFRDGLWADEPPGTGRHDIDYFVEEATTFCQQALDALLAPAPLARDWPDSWIHGPGIQDHFASFAWDDAWRDSNRVMFALAQLCHDAERHGRPELLRAVDAGLEWLDARQSPRTGLWEGPHAVSLLNAMAATFHFTFFYGYRGRPLRYAERIIDSCLALQEAHGLFSGRDVGHTCLDYDALDLLAKAALVTDHRSRDVAEAMRRAREALLELHDPSTGAFVHCRERMGGPRTRRLRRLPLAGRLNRLLPVEREPVSAPFHTGSALLSSEGTAGNALSTWFRSIALEHTRPSSVSPGAPAPRFRRLPFLGFHDARAIEARRHVSGRVSDERPGRRAVRDVRERGPTVSVVIPARNEAERLPDALAALRRQTYPRWEAIVVDDGSEDGTGRLAEAWSRAEPRVRVVHQEGRGLAAARNAALQRARGELIHCLDADDGIDASFYEEVVSALRRADGRSPVGRCAVTRVALVWEHDGIGRVDPAPEPGEMRLRELARRNVRQPVCHVFERRILDATGAFDESLAHCQDWDLWLRFARVGVEFLPVDTALAWYRLRSDSLSSNYAGYLRDGAAVMRRALGTDPRCAREATPPLEDPAPVQEGMARFWKQNLLRAVNREDEGGIRCVFEWGRENLPKAFWTNPERYGVWPRFDWAYDAPPPESRSCVAMWDRGSLFLSALAKHWQELDPERSRRAGRALLARLVEEMERGDNVGEAPRIPRTSGVTVLARHVGWMSPRPVGLWALLLMPPTARSGILGLFRRLRLAGAQS